jgi:lipid A 3-O-deacylase
MPIRRVVTGSILALFLIWRPADGQVRLVLENDLFSPHPLGKKAPDFEYTAGTRLSWASAHTAWWAARLDRALGARDTAGGLPRLRTRWEVGQEIYTPRIDAVEPLPGERPYAGWLYGAVTASAARPGRTRSLTLQLGVTGPPSLAEPVQDEIHKIGGFRPPLGWGHQLAFEPGVVLRYGEAWTAARDLGGASAEIGPEWEAALGNVLTAARAGLRARIGTAALRRGGDGVFVAGGVREEWVGRNLFLDGNTFRGGPRVEKLAFVPQAEVGVGVRLGWLGLGYRAIYRGREYRTQATAHPWGSISLELHPQ